MEPMTEPHEKRSRWKRWLVIITGWAFVLLGIAGLFLPILQGILFLAFGLSLLATEYHWARQMVERLRRKFPWLDQKLHALHEKFRKKHSAISTQHSARKD
jgi:uncharacterized membrane protein YbaN (DUF454 family)